MAASFGKMPTTVGAALDLSVEPLQRVCGMDLNPVCLREAHEGEHVGFGVVHERCELRELAAQLIGDRAPPLDRSPLAVLGERGVDEGQHHLPLSLAGVRQSISEEVNSAALPGRFQHLRHSGFDADVRIGDRQLHATQSTAHERAQETRPERLCLRRPDRHSLSR